MANAKSGYFFNGDLLIDLPLDISKSSNSTSSGICCDCLIALSSFSCCSTLELEQMH